MKKLLVVSILTATLTLIGFTWATTYAHTSGGKAKGAHLRNITSLVFTIARRAYNIAGEVNLTAEQKSSIREILIQARPEIVTTQQQLTDKKRDLRHTLLAREVTQIKVDQLGQEIANLNAQLSLLRIQTAREVTQHLTPTQKETLLKDLQAIDPLVEDLKDELHLLLDISVLKTE
jgi:Spy/CpxP family protein refolding chaperone